MIRLFIAITSLLVFLPGCSQNDEELRRLIRDEIVRSQARSIVDPVETIGPYSPGVRVGGIPVRFRTNRY